MSDLKAIPLTHTRPVPDIAALFRSEGQKLLVSRGGIVFFEGQRYKGVYFLSRGTLKWFRLDHTGNECVLKLYTAGEVAGLPPLFERSETKHYVATLKAISDAELYFWSEGDFHGFMRQHPEHLLAFNEQLSRTLKDLVEQTSAVSLKSVPARLFEYLEKLGASMVPVRLPLRKHELASALNTCPESLSRAFSRLLREGRIVHENGNYRVQNEHARH
ncbi:MAG: Crp/Fnr family transcriptional regulator [Spirochaetota bacterium]